MHTISPQTHILFIMPRSKKGLGMWHKSGTGNNQGSRRTTPRDNRGSSCNDCHSKSIEMSLPVIYDYLPLNNSVINPPQLSLVCQHSKSNELSSQVIPKLPKVMIHSLIQLSCPRFINSHPDLHLTQRMSCSISRAKNLALTL